MSIPLAFLRAIPPPPPSVSIGDCLASALSKSNITTLLSCLPSIGTPALHSPDLARLSLSHSSLKRFIQNFALPRSPGRATLGTNDTILLVLPTGPENALALLALASYHRCAPINASCTAAELRADARRLNATAVLTTRDVEERLELRALQVELGCEIVFVEPRTEGPCALFDMSLVDMEEGATQKTQMTSSDGPSTLNGLHDRPLILHTSGTSGKKKVVPYTLLSLIVGACAVVQSWDLRDKDVNFNMMPLFHVGGIVRNLLAVRTLFIFSPPPSSIHIFFLPVFQLILHTVTYLPQPLFSGSSSIVCEGFDPVAFWELAERLQATWYYAAPTMHHAILASKPPSLVPAMNLSIRMVCNAAGGLLPSLAAELQKTFQAVVLPSYGMTECMPITSPPASYLLDRPGCSGIACGPYLSIRDPSNLANAFPAGTTGAICVRGLPTFEGYEASSDPSVPLDVSAFTHEGWFDSGDMGHLDRDGYLFVTGRSKEIINRGGEVVSPLEIEEAIMSAAGDYVKTTLAFGVKHDVLQETIGVVVVPVPTKPRIGLARLQDLLRNHLHPSKWPVTVVYMDDLPKNSAGKPLRINLAARLGIGCLSDSVPALGRHFEAEVPDALAPLFEPITCHRVTFSITKIERALLNIHGVHEVAVRHRTDGSPEAFVSVCDRDAQELRESISSVLPGYAVPESLYVFPTKLHKNGDGEIDFAALEAAASEINISAMSGRALLLRDIIGNLLGTDTGKIDNDSDFFLLGGNSLLLGKLAYRIRKETRVDINVTTLFRHTTIKEIASLIEASDNASIGESDSCVDSELQSQLHETIHRHELSHRASEATLIGEHDDVACNQTHPLCLIIQAIPFVLFYPLKNALTWTVLLLTLAELAPELAPHVKGSFWKRILCLLTATVVARFFTGIVSPVSSIIFKWIVIGRYKPGTYRMWSGYYLRYWIVNQGLRVAGRGIFSVHPSLEILYYRFLGARIGKNVKIDTEAGLGEFDLLTFSDGCVVDNALIRGFCVEREGFFTLDRVSIGRHAVINTHTQIAPGAVIADGAVYGPHTSSHDAPSPEGFASYSRPMIPEPRLLMKLFVAWPIVFVVYSVSYLPWFAVLWLMTNEKTTIEDGLNSLESLVDWFTTPERIFYHILSHLVRALITPMLQLALGILIKRAFGLNTETNLYSQPAQIALLRRYINSYTLSKSVLMTAFSILGTHYEAVSIVFRAMGAKIGRRIYWPNSGIFCLDPELLEIGDDVVFGSRSEVLTTDCLGTAKIVVGDGAMIADRVVLLPGAKIGRLALMGSGALALRNKDYKNGSIWLGTADCLDDGSNNDLNHDTSTPFGRAFYQNKAPYTVYPYFLILAINIAVIGLSTTYWSIGAVTAAQVLRRVGLWAEIHGNLPYRPSWFRPAVVYGINALSFVIVLNIQAVLVIFWMIATKWIIIGRRQDGQYPWDTSSYCQRWQLHLVLSGFVDQGYRNGGVLGPLTGTAYFVWYLRAIGSKVGKNCALYPGGRMGPMSEPDLVQLGNNVSLDDCSVVAHINPRGDFALNSLVIGNGCAMRPGSRLLSGASMEDSSMLCEHTLLTSGDVADSGAVYSGWPAKQIAGPLMTRRTKSSRNSHRT
ncbi:acetyl-CoA synthetase-like protein [Mycena rebaudengoi]|nr:acetyl-CoA synthetase-like protein [Mycena rebaudengoi]